jgi:hypothetical protein
MFVKGEASNGMGFDVNALAIGCSVTEVTASFVLSNARCSSKLSIPDGVALPVKSAAT